MFHLPSTKERSVVIIVDPKTGQSRSINVSSPHLRNLRYYFAGVALVFGTLVIACWWLYTAASDHEEQHDHLVSRVLELEGQLPKSADTLKAQEYVQRIEEKLRILNDYLKKRGIKGFTQNAVGGEETDDLKMAPELYYSLLDGYLERVFEGIVYTPLGLPARSEITSNYGYRRNPFTNRAIEFHSGIDFRGNRGDRVRSTANGRVVAAGWNSGYGKCVQVKHEGGYETLYGHLSQISVKAGDKIVAGQVLGTIGSTGRSSGNHLHYEVRKNGRPVNPVDFLELN